LLPAQIGDWGRMGNGNQRRAAQMMADVASCMPPAFVISTGDNFYESGLKSANDIQFQESFVKVYHHPQLQVGWRPVAQLASLGSCCPCMCYVTSAAAAPAPAPQLQGWVPMSLSVYCPHPPTPRPLLQVNWYAVLGNHDYGNGIDPMANTGCAATTLEQCPKDCCYSPVWQVRGRGRVLCYLHVPRAVNTTWFC
jgi:hypothetical protein